MTYIIHSSLQKILSREQYLDDEKGCVNMCIAFENTKRKMMEIGYAEGFREGFREGFILGYTEGFALRYVENLIEREHKTLLHLVKNKLTRGYDAETISEHLGLSLTSVQALLMEIESQVETV